MKTSDIQLLGADDTLIAQTAAEALANGTTSTPKGWDPHHFTAGSKRFKSIECCVFLGLLKPTMVRFSSPTMRNLKLPSHHLPVAPLPLA